MKKILLWALGLTLIYLPISGHALTQVRITCTNTSGVTGSYTYGSAVVPKYLASGSNRSANRDAKHGFSHSTAKHTNTGTTRKGGPGTEPTHVGGYIPTSGDKCTRTFMSGGEPVMVHFTMP
jgi:hypothetical protein